MNVISRIPRHSRLFVFIFYFNEIRLFILPCRILGSIFRYLLQVPCFKCFFKSTRSSVCTEYCVMFWAWKTFVWVLFTYTGRPVHYERKDRPYKLIGFFFFLADEYTKITTPRQDVLFKKGYLGRRKHTSVPVITEVINENEGWQQTRLCYYDNLRNESKYKICIIDIGN